MNERLRPEGEIARNKILEAIQSFSDKHGYSPTVREICEITGIKSTSTVQRHLSILEVQEKIARGPVKFRTIRIIKGA